MAGQSTSTSLFVEDPEGNMLKFYVDYPLEDWLYRTHLHSMHIKAMNIPKLLSYTTEVGWQGIPKDTKIGNIHLKQRDYLKLNNIIKPTLV